jgi:hypothetical protein
MTTPWKALTGSAVAVISFCGLAHGEEVTKPTKEACQTVCPLGFTKKNLSGKDKDFFNQCADAKFCADPKTRNQALEKRDISQILRGHDTDSWFRG